MCFSKMVPLLFFNLMVVRELSKVIKRSDLNYFEGACLANTCCVSGGQQVQLCSLGADASKGRSSLCYFKLTVLK